MNPNPAADEQKLRDDLAEAEDRVDYHKKWLEEWRDRLRETAIRLSDAAPFECETCRAGMWDKDHPHKHWLHGHANQKRDTLYTAKIIERTPKQAP